MQEVPKEGDILRPDLDLEEMRSVLEMTQTNGWAIMESWMNRNLDRINQSLYFEKIDHVEGLRGEARAYWEILDKI